MERATKVRNDKILAALGVRMIGGDLAETPEKMRENDHGRNDRRRTENTVQNIHKDNNNSI